MGTRQVVVEFIGKDRGLNSTLDGAESRTSRLGSTMARVGKVAALGLAAGGVLAGKALVEMTKNAAEDEAGQRRLAISLKNSVNATDEQVAAMERWISKQGVALGVTDDELRPAMQRLVESTGSIKKAQYEMGIAMDVSAGTGKSLKVVTEALMKANNGTTASLSKLGLKTKDAHGNALSLDEALKHMSETFKGQAAANANTLQGKMDRLKLVFDEAKESIGAKLIPVVTKLATWFLEVALPAIQRFSAFLHEKLPPIFERVREVIHRVMHGSSGDIASSLKSIRDIIVGFVQLVRAIWDRWGEQITNTVKRNFQLAMKVISGALLVIRGVIKVLTGLIKGDWGMAWDGVKDILRGALQIALAIVRNFGATVRAIWSGIWGAIKSAAAQGLDNVMDAVRALPGRLHALAGLWGSAGRALIGAFVDGMKGAAGIVSGIAGNVWSAIKSLINSAIGRLNSALTIHIGLPGPDINFSPHIPYLARGGIVKARPGGTLALIGEAGHDEAVVPLSGPFAPSGLGGGPVVVQLYLDGRAVHQSLLKIKRTTGQGLGLA